MFKGLITKFYNVQVQNASLSWRLFVLTAHLEADKATCRVNDVKETENVQLFN